MAYESIEGALIARADGGGYHWNSLTARRGGSRVIRHFATAALACAALGACSTIVEGYHQEISINTNPAGATCVLDRQGVEIGRVAATPGIVRVEKTKYDITIVCDKDGFQQVSQNDHSGAAAATFGNIIAGGGIGWIIDSASGSDNKYDSPVNITLVPKATAALDTQKPAAPTK
mgnify:CR=1 FL=1